MLSQEELDKCQALLADERFDHKEIVGVFTYGSQTLGLNNEDSDVDLLMMTVPTAKELFRNGRPIREHTASNNEKIVQYRLPGLMRPLAKMELQMVEAISRPLYIAKQFKPMYELMIEYMETADAQLAFDKTLYYVCRSYAVKGQPSLKDEAKAYVYYKLHESGEALYYYLENQVPQSVLTTYHDLRSGNLSKEERLAIHEKVVQYLENTEPDTHKNTQSLKEYQVVENALAAYTIEAAYLQMKG